MNGEKPTVLVTGANGRLGRALVDAFSTAGWRVRAQVRDKSRWSDAWPQSVEPLFCDARDATALLRAAEGVDALANALNPVYTQWEENALPMSNNAIAAARASGALLLFPGNVYNFGKELPEQLHDETPQVGNTPKARIRIEMEMALRAAADEGLDAVVLRSGDYFGGPVRHSWFDLAIVADLARGKVIYPGPTSRLHAWAYLPDLASAFVRVAAQRARLRGFHALHFPGYAITGAELHSVLENVVARPLRLKSMNWWRLRLAGPFSPMARALLDMRYLWNRPHRLLDGPLQDLIGPMPSTSLFDALRATLADLGLLPTHEGVRHV